LGPYVLGFLGALAEDFPMKNRALDLPTTRRDPESGYTSHGRWFDDPYAWLERLDSAETQAWLAAQEAVTHAVLRAVPGREGLRAAVARSARHARLSPPIPAGPHGREFLWQADARDDKLKFMLRRGRGAPLETVLDPNTWAGEEALVFAVPSPDGARVAFGKAMGSTHAAVIHVLDVETGQVLADRPRGTSHSSLAWRPDASGFFYAACPEPAFANVRGGGEYGRAWHEAACKTRRQKAFDDYIAAARWLVSAGYTTPSRLASRGNSNGGLLVAVTALQAPEAFGAVYCRAPLLDMLRFPNFGYLGLAVVEYGSPEDPIEGAYLAGYSPYHNVRADRRYPVMTFVSALNDRVAPPHDPLKMVARLQAEGRQGGPYFLLPLRDSGHGGGTTLTALVEQDVDELSFYCWALDVAPPTPGEASDATAGAAR
jgi:prolyl oligopeptidase PreP (S9A serine peptidase family)